MVESNNIFAHLGAQPPGAEREAADAQVQHAMPAEDHDREVEEGGGGG